MPGMPRSEEMTDLPPIRVLIIDDVADDAHAIRTWLTSAADISVIHVAQSFRDGVRAAHKLTPDIVLLSAHLHEISGLHAIQTLSSDLPLRIILMSTDESRESYQQAMIAGARAVIAKPPRSDHLLRTIRAVAQAPMPSSSGHGTYATSQPGAGGSGRHVIVVCGPKGGVGRSIIATNLAVCLAQLPARTVLIDANLETGVDHLLLTLSPRNSLATLLDKDELDWQSIEQTAERHPCGLYLLRAPHRLSDADRFRQEDMRAILLEAQDHFDYIVVDADSRFSVGTIAALKLAERILVVTTLEITAVGRVSEFLDTLQEASVPEALCLLVGNRTDGGYRITPRQIERSLSRKFAILLPDDVRTVITSVNEGTPFVIAQRRTAIARAIHELAQRLAKEMPASPVETPARR